MGSYIRLIKLQSQHLRLCLNSLALRNAFADDLRDTTSAMSSFLTSAAMSALDIIQAYIESVSGDGYFNFCLDVRRVHAPHNKLLIPVHLPDHRTRSGLLDTPVPLATAHSSRTLGHPSLPTASHGPDGIVRSICHRSSISCCQNLSRSMSSGPDTLTSPSNRDANRRIVGVA